MEEAESGALGSSATYSVGCLAGSLVQVTLELSSVPRCVEKVTIHTYSHNCQDGCDSDGLDPGSS
jgi:hypothetical protein